MTADGFPAEPQDATRAGSWTTVGGSVGSLIDGGTFHGPVRQDSHTYYNYFRDVIAAMALDPSEVERRRTTFVEPPEFGAARFALQRESAVALLGQPGCGRRTTGMVLLAAHGVTPKSVVLDPEDFDLQLEIAPDHGYLLDLDEDSDQLTPKAGAWIGDLVARLRAMESCLVVRARERSWRALGPNDDVLPAIGLTPPPAISVFRAHLALRTSAPVADAWARYEQIGGLLCTAAPPDGVRLARIVAETSTVQVPGEQQLTQVVATYRNWAAELATWFRESAGQAGAYRRALLLAAAALEGAPAATVFAAADRLAGITGLPREPGGALAGPDASELVSQIQAELRDASIRFARPAYGTSVLDHVWSQRPHLRADLREWLTSIPGSGDEGSGLAAQALAKLAIRRQEANLVCSAARQWAAESASRRELAVEALTDAALSEEIGRDVRRQLYDWARTTGAGETTHLAVARVCAGPFAWQYPQIALTRLRHLVARPNAAVQESVFESLTLLAGEPALYSSVLSEVARWMRQEDPRRSAGLRAFLWLATPGDGGQIPVLAQADQGNWDLLAKLWRTVLRDDRTEGLAKQAAALAARWLDTAARGQAPREPVLGILAGSCRSSIDVSLLAGIAFAGVGSRESDPVRWGIGTELARRSWERDPILGSRKPVTGERS
ncbi:MAG TPA: hypothetical protein VNF47_00405 [Streptosporangiaceae bacterium]|nr:hypothetical protein [Streptosporangiaceae bacterium]